MRHGWKQLRRDRETRKGGGNKVGHETTLSNTNHEKKHLLNLGSKKRQKLKSNRQGSIWATHR